MNRRMHAALLSVLALILGTGALVLTGTGSATADDSQAAVTLTPSTGTTADVPAFSKVQVSAPCTSPYQASLSVFLTMPNGRDGLLASGITDGAPYSGTSITADVPTAASGTVTLRSIAQAFSVAHQTLADGTYAIHVQCKAQDGTADPVMFTTAIDITGTTWAAKVVTPPTTTSVALTTAPAKFAVVDHDVTLTATVTPADAVGTVTFTVPGGNLGTAVTPVNGVATATLPGISSVGGIQIGAKFTPTDPLKFAPSSSQVLYPFVAEKALVVLDDTGNTVTANSKLAAGAKLKVTVDGFLSFTPGTTTPETVKVAWDSGTPVLPDATPDAHGKVTDYDVTVPSDIADGSHSLVFTGATSGIEQTFAFTTGSGSSPTPDPTDTDTGSPSPDPSDTGTADGGASDGGNSAGGSSDGGSSAGGTSDGGSAAGGSSGGSNGPLAATGADGVIPMTVLALLMVTAGGYAAYRVRRDGRLLTFGPTPRD